MYMYISNGNNVGNMNVHMYVHRCNFVQGLTSNAMPETFLEAFIFLNCTQRKCI
jgi:hypothetical protein